MPRRGAGRQCEVRDEKLTGLNIFNGRAVAEICLVSLINPGVFMEYLWSIYEVFMEYLFDRD